MMENSGTGAVIHIDAVPKPDGMALEQWLLCFQSYGFVLSVPREIRPPGGPAVFGPGASPRAFWAGSPMGRPWTSPALPVRPYSSTSRSTASRVSDPQGPADGLRMHPGQGGGRADDGSRKHGRSPLDKRLALGNGLPAGFDPGTGRPRVGPRTGAESGSGRRQPERGRQRAAGQALHGPQGDSLDPSRPGSRDRRRDLQPGRTTNAGSPAR